MPKRRSTRKWGEYKRLSGNGGRATASCRVTLCPCQDLTLKTQLEAVNGKKMPALEVFAHALRFFKEHALQVHCDPIPAYWVGGPPGPSFPLSPSPVHPMGSHCQKTEVIFSSPLPFYLVEPASTLQVLGRWWWWGSGC